MKHNFITILLFVITISVATLMTNCKETPKDYQENVENPKDELEIVEQSQSISDSINDYHHFKEATLMKLNKNEEKILVLKKELSKAKKEMYAQYNDDLNDLEDKNAKLKNRVQNYNTTHHDRWEQYKISTNQELEELEKSISDLSSRNLK